ncbi:unnamed protein product [Effrenium voratum]|nr:unnamed protein product [Effrenium voratum]
MMELMVKSKVYDDVLLTMQRQGRISFYCTNYGEEATSVGTAAALQPQDMIWPQYRELGAFLWRGLTAQEIADQNIGNEGDRSKGRNLQVHYCMLEKNMQTVHAVLGTQIPQAPGAGYAYKLDKEDRVSVTYFGDGAASEGDAFTGLNFASVYGSQTLFICRNNGYSISTGVDDQYGGDGIAARGPALGIPSVRVDGNDLVAVFLATREARRRSVAEQKPTLLELMTYRVGDHTTSDDSSAYRKENKEEVAKLQALGPIPRWRAFLMSKGVWTEEKEKAIATAAREEMLQAMKTGETKKRPPLRDLFTDTYTDLPWHLEEQAAYAEKHVREYSQDYKMSAYRGLDGPAPVPDARRIASAPRQMPPAPTGKTREMTMVQSINEALSIALSSNERTVLFGEDVAFGGVFRCSMGLRETWRRYEKHGEGRVLNAPVAEQAIAAFAIGLSVAGYKAIAEIQFADYIFPAFDQIVNEIAKYRYRNAGGGAGNITIRAPCSAVGHGSMYHSQSVESYFAHCPGLKIVIPRGPKQAKGLLLAAIRDPDPVLFFEPKVLYRAKIEGADAQVPEGDYELPIGQAEVVRPGTDVTLVGWGSQILRLQEAATRAEAEGISCEIIDLQTIVPWDVDTVQASVEKTGRLIVAHEAPQTNGFGAEISSKIQALLDDPAVRTSLVTLENTSKDSFNRKCKIICTMGPCCWEVPMLTKLIEQGMNIARLNFSHGDHETHGATVGRIREACKNIPEKPVAILLDTKGPEIRTGFFKVALAHHVCGDELAGGKINLKEGQELKLVTDYSFKGDDKTLAVSYQQLPGAVKPGSIILAADGSLSLKVKSCGSDHVITEVMNDMQMGEKKNMNLPGVKVDLPVLQDKDKKDLLEFGCPQNVDFIAASFVQDAKDIKLIRDTLGVHGRGIKIISKIENQEGINNIDEIIEATDGVMVARGDMGMEIDIEKVGLVQKMIISKCNLKGKFVVTATQMLDSMERAPRPTRAEATDVLNAVLDGSDVVMLSGETANGKFPEQAVATMRHICERAERVIDYKALYLHIRLAVMDASQGMGIDPIESICSSAVKTVVDSDCKLIIAFSRTGRAARIVAKYRPPCPILAITASEQTLRQLLATRGVVPVLTASFQGTDQVISKALAKAKEFGMVESGDNVCALHGQKEESTDSNLLKVAWTLEGASARVWLLPLVARSKLRHDICESLQLCKRCRGEFLLLLDDPKIRSSMVSLESTNPDSFNRCELSEFILSKCKIICTMGPCCWEVDMLKKLIDSWLEERCFLHLASPIQRVTGCELRDHANRRPPRFLG